MAFYKLCDCGTKNMFEHRGLAPRKCEKCGRSLLEVSAVDEDSVEEQEEISDDNHSEDTLVEGLYYSLNTPDGKEQIVIPSAGGIVGRNALGAVMLREHSAVSREHIKVTYRGRIGLLIEDISKYGTFINGEQLVKGTAKFAHDGDVVKLYDYELVVRRHEEELQCH